MLIYSEGTVVLVLVLVVGRWRQAAAVVMLAAAVVIINGMGGEVWMMSIIINSDGCYF